MTSFYGSPLFVKPQLHLVLQTEEKVCRVCGNPSIPKSRLEHRDYICSTCNRDKVRAWEQQHPEKTRERQGGNTRRYREENPERTMWHAAKQRAKKRGQPFEIEVGDIIIPPCCPVLGIPLKRGTSPGGKDASPSLDCIVPSKGYVRGNIAVISNRANRIKSNATPDELTRVRDWLLTILSKEGL